MDIETGKVVEEWKVHDDIPITNFAPDNVSAAPDTTPDMAICASLESINMLIKLASLRNSLSLEMSKLSLVTPRTHCSGLTLGLAATRW